MTSLKVAVRVRPFSPNEVTIDSRSSLDWDSESSITLKKLTTSEKLPRCQHEARSSEAEAGTVRLFLFDNCFWSDHTSQPNHHATQQTIFETIGAQMLDAVFEGINTSVLAYGQSGTGKTYTMMGTESDPGLAPRLCLEIFERMNANNTTTRNKHTSKSYFRVEVSFMEIYNEKVRDLLNNNASAPIKSPVTLRVREHPKFGPYVEGLKRIVVNSGHEALKLLHSGMQRRMSAATQANIHSSRSHAIFTIYFTTVQVAGSVKPREITAKLNVIDLAGSERTHRDNVNRMRLKEGALINRSLATLGNVINALAEKSSTFSNGFSSTPRLSDLSLASSVSVESFPSASSSNCSPGRRTPFVPYRNSVLTWILKDSLGGNARTFLVAAVSPYSGAYKETLSTLRFAQRAKLVVNRPVVNEESSVAVIRHLKNEVLRLKTLLNQMVDSKESMDDSIIYTEEIIEDSIKVRSPSILEIAELQHGSTDKENPADNGTSAKEFKDASVQTLLTLVNDHTPADDLECFSDASYEEGSSDSNKVFEIKTLNHWEISRESNFEIPKSRKTIERMANSPSSSVSSAKPGTNCCHEEQNLVTPPSPPRSFKQSYGSKQHEKNQDEELAIASRGFKTPVSTQNSLYPIAFDKNAVGSMHNMKKQDELKKEGTRDDSAGISEHSIGANCVFIPDRILRIVRNVQLNSSHLESRNNENKVSTCLCSAKESSLRHASSCCSNLHKLHNEFRLHNFRSSIRQELLAIRRRLVARTASPQVAKALPYLLEAPYRNFARNPNEQC